MGKLRLAICGMRGIPACYGGFETFAEETASRLAERGHEITVYGRRHVIDYQEDTYRGVRLRLLWAPQNKYLETPVHTLLCLVDAVRRDYDAMLVCNAANSPFLWLPRLFGLPTAVNVDGIERLRAKWNLLGRSWYRLGERCSVLFGHRVIADADVIYQYYRERFGAESTVIPYGCSRSEDLRVDRKLAGEALEWTESERALFDELGVSPGSYILYVSRLEPENNAHVAIDAHLRLSEDHRKIPLVVVGDAPYADDYKRRLRELADDRVVFAGYRFGEDYRTLQLGAKVYVQATEVGGTHPALVEAMGFGNCVAANETPENREVLGDSGLIYQKNQPESLAEKLSLLIGDSAAAKRCRELSVQRARTTYDWDVVTSQYEQLFRELCGK